jgi:hypothetical protein
MFKDSPEWWTDDESMLKLWDYPARRSWWLAEHFRPLTRLTKMREIVSFHAWEDRPVCPGCEGWGDVESLV